MSWFRALLTRARVFANGVMDTLVPRRIARRRILILGLSASVVLPGACVLAVTANSATPNPAIAPASPRPAKVQRAAADPATSTRRLPKGFASAAKTIDPTKPKDPTLRTTTGSRPQRN